MATEVSEEVAAGAKGNLLIKTGAQKKKMRPSNSRCGEVMKWARQYEETQEK